MQKKANAKARADLRVKYDYKELEQQKKKYKYVATQAGKACKEAQEEVDKRKRILEAFCKHDDKNRKSELELLSS